MKACEDFRERLAASLLGRPSPPTPNVAWHEHLLGCASCRALLDAEEALEAVLAGLPEPELPERLAERVLARLEPERVVTLEGLLALDRVSASPGLPERVLAGLAEAREAAALERRLDRLLERVPAPKVPEGLAERVLAATHAAALEAAVHGDGVPRAGRPRFAALRGGLAWTAGLAAAGLLAALAWRFAQPARDETPTAPSPRIAADSQPVQHRVPSGGEGSPADDELADAELLAALDVLERWDLLVDDDLALLLASVEPVEEELLDLAYDEDEDEG